MLESVKRVASAGVDGIKIHQLCIYKGTAMENDFLKGQLPVLAEETYVDLVTRSLEILPPEMIVMRLVAEGSRDEIIAPEWSFEKERVMQKMNQLLLERETWQGKKFVATVTAS